MNTKLDKSFSLVIFGVTGNLAQLKLLPALYDLAEAGLLPEKMSIIGVGRKQYSDIEFRQYVAYVLSQPNQHHQHPIKPEFESKLLSQTTYLSGDISKPEIYTQLMKQIDANPNCANKIFYLATYPDLYETIFRNLKTSGLHSQSKGWVRVMIEKPIGQDLASAKQLNSLVSQYFIEDQVYRLDHYLGKETLQNILTFRFGNSIYEQLINKEFVDHIQITATEDFGIGWRGGYYDTVGALKDVGQNHILQMIALATMEAPTEYSNPAITKRRIELINTLVPDTGKIVFGQYEGYLDEKDVVKNSTTDTFFAFRTTIQSERFAGVPIYVRAGKKLHQTVTEIAVVFKVGKRIFSAIPGGNEPNVLIYRVQPNEGIVLRFLTKIPGPDMTLHSDYMQFCYKHMGVPLPDPYLRLLLDALRGDQTFFVDAPEVESQWKFIDPLYKVKTKPEIYAPGSWGPTTADTLIEADGRQWLIPSPAFCAL